MLKNKIWFKHLLGFVGAWLLTYGFKVIAEKLLQDLSLNGENVFTVLFGGNNVISLIFTLITLPPSWLIFGFVFAGYFKVCILVARRYQIVLSVVAGVILSSAFYCASIVHERQKASELLALQEREWSKQRDKETKIEYDEMARLVTAVKAMDRDLIKQNLAGLKMKNMPEALCQLTAQDPLTGSHGMTVDGVQLKEATPLNAEQALVLAEVILDLPVTTYDKQQTLASMLEDDGFYHYPKDTKFLSQWMVLWNKTQPKNARGEFQLAPREEKSAKEVYGGCSHQEDGLLRVIIYRWGGEGIKIWSDSGLPFTLEQKKIILENAKTVKDFKLIEAAGIRVLDVPNNQWLPVVTNYLYANLIGGMSFSKMNQPEISYAEAADIVDELVRQGADFRVRNEQGREVCEDLLTVQECKCEWQTPAEKKARNEAVERIRKAACTPAALMN